MRIDLHSGTQATPENNRSNAQNPPNAGSSSLVGSSALGEDQAELSGAHAQVESLAAQAAQLPEVRQERVSALRQAVESGQYHPRLDQVAGALFTHLIAAPA